MGSINQMDDADTGDNKLPPTAGLFDFGYSDDAYAFSTTFPFENDTPEGLFNVTPGSFAASHEDLCPGDPGDPAWINDEGSQTLPTRQYTQNYSGHSSWSSIAAPYVTTENKESEPLPLPRNPLGGYRGLPRRRSRYIVQEIDQQPNAVFIPPSSGPADPLERWKQSPPEGEAASLTDIEKALENSSIYSGGLQGSGTPRSGRRTPRSRAPSTGSGRSATSTSSQRSNRSRPSALSNGSQDASEKTPSRIQKKKKQSSASNPRIFCCTFCCDKFKSKYDWMRHENSLHLNLERWVCAPFGGSVVLPSTGRTHCAYCNQLDPTPEHLEQHNHPLCQQHERSFRRKDHLLQHMRLFHNLDTSPLIDGWKRVTTDFPSRCGFCDGRMSNWDERADHLTFHFRRGYTMA